MIHCEAAFCFIEMLSITRENKITNRKQEKLEVKGLRDSEE